MTRQMTMVLGLLCLALGATQAGEMTEAKKRAEFAKAYASAMPEDRLAAVLMLQGVREEASVSFLRRVATKDVEPAVRLSAFLLISDMDDPLGKLERVIVDMFRNEKNRPTKISMLQAFTKLKTKTEATEEAIKFLGTLRYPSSYSDRELDENWNQDEGLAPDVLVRRLSKEQIDAMRKNFTDVLTFVNLLAEKSFPSNDTARLQSKQWWALRKNDFLKADAEMIIKLRKEARADAKKDTTKADAKKDTTEADAKKDTTEADAKKDTTKADAKKDTTEADTKKDTTEADAKKDTTEADAKKDTTETKK
jgi:hypothetical protein